MTAAAAWLAGGNPRAEPMTPTKRSITDGSGAESTTTAESPEVAVTFAIAETGDAVDAAPATRALVDAAAFEAAVTAVVFEDAVDVEAADVCDVAVVAETAEAADAAEAGNAFQADEARAGSMGAGCAEGKADGDDTVRAEALRPPPPIKPCAYGDVRLRQSLEQPAQLLSDVVRTVPRAPPRTSGPACKDRNAARDAPGPGTAASSWDARGSRGWHAGGVRDASGDAGWCAAGGEVRHGEPGRLSMIRGELVVRRGDGMQLGDEAAVERWCAWARTAMPAMERAHRLQYDLVSGYIVVRELDLSRAALGDLGLLAVLRQLQELHVGVQIFRLFRNRLGRGAACVMADWISSSPVPVLELHASDNYMPTEGVLSILTAVVRSPLYPPRRGGAGPAPLWLRIEGNLIAKPAAFARDAEAAMWQGAPPELGGSAGPLVCLVQDWAAGCKSTHCEKYGRWGACPHVHLTYHLRQLDAHVHVPPEACAWDAAADQEVEADRWRTAKRELPAVPEALSNPPPPPQDALKRGVAAAPPPPSTPPPFKARREPVTAAWPPPPPSGDPPPKSIAATPKNRPGSMSPQEQEPPTQVDGELQRQLRAGQARGDDGTPCCLPPARPPRGARAPSQPPAAQLPPAGAGPPGAQRGRAPPRPPPRVTPADGETSATQRRRSSPRAGVGGRGTEEGTSRRAALHSSAGGMSARPVRQRPPRNDGERVPLREEGEEAQYGQVVKWTGGMHGHGWIEPERRIHHPAASLHRGQVFLGAADCAPGVRVGGRVRFLLYSDNSGLGAENCQAAA